MPPAPPIFSLDVFISAMTLRWLRRPDMSRKITVKVFLDQQQQLALIWALMLSVASGGLFATSGLNLHRMDHNGSIAMRIFGHLCGFFFCSGVMAFVFAVFGSLLLMMAARNTPTDHEFLAFYTILGPTLPSLPMLMGMYGVVASFFGLIAFFGLLFSEEYTWCCLAVCSLSFPVVWYALMALTRAVEAMEGVVGEHRVPIVTSADDIYDKLRDYYLECGSLQTLQRAEFLESIGCVDSGSAIASLAKTIYDDWMKKKIQGLLRQDPGF